MKNVWRRLSLLIGAGALLGHGARAGILQSLDDGTDPAGAARHRGAEVLLKLENDNVYFSQDAGRTFQELELAATPETKRLKTLLEQRAVSNGAGGMKVSPMLVADGAGGLQWARPKSAPASDGARPTTTRARSAITNDARPAAAPTRAVQRKAE